MKFTIITRYYHPTPDGIAHHSAYLHQHLINTGHQVNVIYDDGIISLKTNEIGILVSKIKHQKSDWVIFQYNGYSYDRFGAPSWLSNFYKKIKSKTNAKLCIIVHETFIRKEEGLKLKIYRFLQKRALRIASKQANSIITTTHLYQEQLKNLGYKSEVFFTPSNFENFISNATLPKDTQELIIGTFGNRDPKFLLKIIELLDQKGLVCKFNFIGNYQPKYIKQIKDFSKKTTNITITRSGKLTDNNIVQHLIKLDAFILLEPVREDGGGGLNTKSGASATAFCMGIPIFSTEGDFTHKEVFKKNENYICLNHHDYLESSEIIFKYLNNKIALKEIGLNGKDLYQKHFAWVQYVNRMLKLMQIHKNG